MRGDPNIHLSRVKGIGMENLKLPDSELKNARTLNRKYPYSFSQTETSDLDKQGLYTYIYILIIYAYIYIFRYEAKFLLQPKFKSISRVFLRSENHKAEYNTEIEGERLLPTKLNEIELPRTPRADRASSGLDMESPAVSLRFSGG